MATAPSTRASFDAAAPIDELLARTRAMSGGAGKAAFGMAWDFKNAAREAGLGLNVTIKGSSGVGNG